MIMHGLLFRSIVSARQCASFASQQFGFLKKASAMASASGIMASLGMNLTGHRPVSDMAAFRDDFARSNHIVILTGAGVSAESGVPTFRGEGGLWRKWQATELATPEAFNKDPSIVWEFYHYRRELMRAKHPNAAHTAIAECEERLKKQGRRVVVITQNIDSLHARAGSKNIIELHGNLFKVRCTSCGKVEPNSDSPICESLRDKGAPDLEATDARIPVEQLPRCRSCKGLLRPHVVWFGESLEMDVLRKVNEELVSCDLCLVVGTSSVVYPAAMFAPELAMRGISVAEFNVEQTPASGSFTYYFEGPCGTTLKEALAAHPNEPPATVNSA